MNPTRIRYDGPESDEIVNQAKKKLAAYEEHLRDMMGEAPVGTKKLQLSNCDVTLEVFGVTNRLTITAPTPKQVPKREHWQEISVEAPIIQEIIRRYTRLDVNQVRRVEFEMLPGFVAYPKWSAGQDKWKNDSTTLPVCYQLFSFGANDDLIPYLQLNFPPEQAMFYENQVALKSYEAAYLFDYEKKEEDIARIISTTSSSSLVGGVKCTETELIFQLHPKGWNGVDYWWYDNWEGAQWIKQPDCTPKDKCHKCPAPYGPGRSTTWAYRDDYDGDWFPCYVSYYDYPDWDYVKLVGTPSRPWWQRSGSSGEWKWHCAYYCSSPMFTIHYEVGGFAGATLAEFTSPCSQFWINPATGSVDCGGMWDGEMWLSTYKDESVTATGEGTYSTTGVAISPEDWAWTGILRSGTWEQPNRSIAYGHTYSYEYAGQCSSGASSIPSDDPTDIAAKCHDGYLQAVLLDFTIPEFEVYIKEMQCHRIYQYSGIPEVLPQTVLDPETGWGGSYLKPEYLPDFVYSGPNTIDYDKNSYYHGEVFGEALVCINGWTYEVGKSWGSQRQLKEYQPWAGTGAGGVMDYLTTKWECSEATGGHIYAFGTMRMYVAATTFLRPTGQFGGYLCNEGVTNEDGTPVDLAPFGCTYRPLLLAVFMPSPSQHIYGEIPLEEKRYAIHADDVEAAGTHYIPYYEYIGVPYDDPEYVNGLHFSPLRDLNSETNEIQNTFEYRGAGYGSTSDSCCFVRLKLLSGEESSEEEVVRKVVRNVR